MSKSKKALHYLIYKLGEKIDSRKKIMKLMFLVNHYDVEKNRLVKKPFLKDTFFISQHGVFSFEVLNNFLSLDKTEKIHGDEPVEAKSRPKLVSSKIKNKIDSIVEKFGDKSGNELETYTLKQYIKKFIKD